MPGCALVAGAIRFARGFVAALVFIARGAIEQVGEPAAIVALRVAWGVALRGAKRRRFEPAGGRWRKARGIARRRTIGREVGPAAGDGKRLFLAHRAPCRL